MLVLPTKSNAKVTKLKPVVKTPVSKADLSFSDGKFTIARKFLEGQTDGQGWSITSDNGSVYLLQTVSEDTAGFAIFLKDQGVSPTFKSNAANDIFAGVGFDTTQPMTLTEVDSSTIEGANGFRLFKVSVFGAPATEQTPAVEQEQSAVVENLDVPTDNVIDDVPAVEETPATEAVVTQEFISPEAVAQFGQVGVEEQAQEAVDAQAEIDQLNADNYADVVEATQADEDNTALLS